MSLLTISYFFYFFSTVTWLGGIFFLALLVFPETKRILSGHPALDSYLARLRKRFFPLINFSMVLLIFTGFIQMSGDANYDGVLQFTNEWSQVMLFKHIAFIGMIVFGALLQFTVAPALERLSLLIERGKGDPAQAEALRRRETQLTWINVGLGVLVLLFTAWATAL